MMQETIVNPPPRKPLHACLVILLYTVGGVVAAVIIATLINLIPERFEPPSQLPPLPEKAETFRSIKATDSSFDWAVIVQTAGGKYYTYEWNGKGSEWSEHELLEWEQGSAMPNCPPEVVQAIKASSGEITHCGLFHPFSEYCPTLEAYAITLDGYVWIIDVPQSCTLLQIVNTIKYIIILTPMGFIFGVIFVVLRGPINKRADVQQNKYEIGK